MFNAEFYNFVELRDELQKLGHVFCSKSDTEVLLASYIEWGSDLLARLNGMYAFALYDSFQQKILLARDHTGEKPPFLIHSRFHTLFCFRVKSSVVPPKASPSGQ